MNDFYQPLPSDLERSEFTEWLKTNKLMLAKYDSDELAHMAITCGFRIEVICDVLSHYIMDRLTYTRYSTRENWYVDRELKATERGMGLSEQWEKLANYLIDGKEF